MHCVLSFLFFFFFVFLSPYMAIVSTLVMLNELVTKDKDLIAQALLGKDHAGKPFSTLGSHVPH